MKKLIYISFILAFMVAFASCEKEVITPKSDVAGETSSSNDNGDRPTRGSNPGAYNPEGEGDDGDGNITDPDEDEDFDNGGEINIVDPDEDEDFDEGENGK